MNGLSSLANDLTYLMYTSTDHQTRNDKLDVVLKNYYKTFESITTHHNIAMPFTYDELVEEYFSKSSYGFLFALCK